MWLALYHFLHSALFRNVFTLVPWCKVFSGRCWTMHLLSVSIYLALLVITNKGACPKAYFGVCLTLFCHPSSATVTSFPVQTDLISWWCLWALQFKLPDTRITGIAPHFFTGVSLLCWTWDSQVHPTWFSVCLLHSFQIRFSDRTLVWSLLRQMFKDHSQHPYSAAPPCSHQVLCLWSMAWSAKFRCERSSGQLWTSSQKLHCSWFTALLTQLRMRLVFTPRVHCWLMFRLSAR